ncbi:MAG: FecR domain-containing protein [Saprospiraceae bacterium]|nr:FecR domain-containing protein [Saprospiraceae bacterium]
MPSNDDYILLLAKQYSGEITPAESAMLNDWLAQSPDNTQLATQLKNVWEKTGGYGKTFTPDLDAAFGQLQNRIRASEPPRGKVVPLGRQLLRIAAALIFILASVWTYRTYTTPETVKASAANEEKRLIELPDGSRVWLRHYSEITYPVQFSRSERHVSLTGEAYFEVAHDAEHPFFVDLPNGDVIKVLGTRFGIRLADNQNQTDVFVRDGKVLFSPKYQPGGVVLTARQKASYLRKTTRLIVDKNATLNELSWQTGGLEFEHTPMAEVLSDLEQYFNVKITLQNTAMRACLHTAPLTGQSLDKVLESLALTYQFRVTSPTPGQYVLSGGNCQ